MTSTDGFNASGPGEMTPRQRVHAAIEGKPYDRTPVTPIFMAWCANFIGRTYREYYLHGEVMADAQIAAMRRFNTDQVSVISDPWREAADQGMTFDWPDEGVGIPHHDLIQSEDDLAKLKTLKIEDSPRMLDRLDSLKRMLNEVGDTHSVMGWVEGPMALYADLRNVENAMMDMITEPDMFQRACEVIMPNQIHYAIEQVKAGADIIGVGDAAASLMGPDLYQQYLLELQKQLFDEIHNAGAKVKLHICGNINAIMPMLPDTGADVIDCDWMVPLAKTRRIVGPDVCLAGNFDPSAVLWQGSPESVAKAAKQNIHDAGDRFILQPGCEVPPATTQQNIAAFCPCQDSLVFAAV